VRAAAGRPEGAPRRRRVDVGARVERSVADAEGRTPAVAPAQAGSQKATSRSRGGVVTPRRWKAVGVLVGVLQQDRGGPAGSRPPRSADRAAPPPRTQAAVHQRGGKLAGAGGGAQSVPPGPAAPSSTGSPGDPVSASSSARRSGERGCTDRCSSSPRGTSSSALRRGGAGVCTGCGASGATWRWPGVAGAVSRMWCHGEQIGTMGIWKVKAVLS